MKRNKLLFGILILCSCEPKLDPAVTINYQEIDQGLEWYFETIILRNAERMRSWLADRGNPLKENEMIDSMLQYLVDYRRFNDMLDDCEEKDYDENYEYLILLGVNDSLQQMAIPEVNQWLQENEIITEYLVSKSRTDWLLFRLDFKWKALAILNSEFQKVYQQLQPKHFVYTHNDKIEANNIYPVFERVLIDGKSIYPDSTGVFKVETDGPFTIKWPMDPPGLQQIKDMEFTYQPTKE